MIAVLDKLIILYIYINIFANKFTIFSISLGKSIFFTIITLFMLHLIFNTHKAPKRSSLYILISFLLILLLSTISIFLGNQLENIIEFVKPLLILLSIPVLILITQFYEIERYLNHLLIATFILSAYVFILFVFFSQFPTWNTLSYYISEIKELGTTILYRESGLQVHVVTGGWFPIGLAICYYKLQDSVRVGYFISALLILFAIYISKTTALWSGSVCALCLYILLSNKFHFFKIMILLGSFIIASIIAINLLPEDIIESKIYSVSQKQEQSSYAMEIFYENMIVGKGLGYIFSSSRVPSMSGEENIFLEVTYPMILATTGLIGAFFYAFIFLFYPIEFVLTFPKKKIQMLLFSCCIAIFVEAIGNPYLWGGGLGLFLTSFLAASLDMKYYKLSPS